jgi:hypothetical protein
MGKESPCTVPGKRWFRYKKLEKISVEHQNKRLTVVITPWYIFQKPNGNGKEQDRITKKS